MKKTELAQYFSREHTMFYSLVWYKSNTTLFNKWAGFDFTKMLCIGEKDKKVSVWYSREELQDYDTAIVKNILNKYDYFDSVEKSYNEGWNNLLKYISGEIIITRSEDFKDYFDLWKSWWSSMAVIFETVDLFHLPQKIRDRALTLREETQAYADKLDQIFVSSFIRVFPEFKDQVFFFHPEYIFSNNMEVGSKRADIFKENGYFVFGEVLPLSQLDGVLEKNNLMLEKILIENTNTINGFTAYAGKVSGKVKVVSYKNQLGDVENGDILVTEMTSPDFLFALNKCSAFVTDEGGITCHAAIVARELKKPCIIGTRIATKVLKDGDLVEVDANNGIIRILN